MENKKMPRIILNQKFYLEEVIYLRSNCDLPSGDIFINLLYKIWYNIWK